MINTIQVGEMFANFKKTMIAYDNKNCPECLTPTLRLKWL